MTESPFTVDAGHLQIEASFLAFTRDRYNPERNDTRVTTWNIAPVNVRVGLRHHLEIQIVSDNYLEVKSESLTADVERHRGFGDMTLRFKINLWGNDEGSTALAVMPFVKLPTSTNGLGNRSYEGGLIIPFAADLGGGWGLGAMTELDYVRNETDDGYEAAWLNTVALGCDLTERMGMFGELAATVGMGKPALLFNLGATYAVNPDVQFDCGANFALSRAADDITFFAGLTTRF